MSRCPPIPPSSVVTLPARQSSGERAQASVELLGAVPAVLALGLILLQLLALASYGAFWVWTRYRRYG